MLNDILMRYFQPIVMLFFALNAFSFEPELSNDFRVSTSEPFLVVDAESKLYFSDNNNYSFAFKTSEGCVTIQKFDFEDMKEVRRNVYNDLPANIKVINTVCLNGKFFYIYECYNKKEKNNSAFAREIDLADGSFSREVKLFTTTCKVVYETKKTDLNIFGEAPIYRGRPFDIYLSNDSSKMMIVYKKRLENRGS